MLSLPVVLHGLRKPGHGQDIRESTIAALDSGQLNDVLNQFFYDQSIKLTSRYYYDLK